MIFNDKVRGRVVDVRTYHEDPRNVALHAVGNAAKSALKVPLYFVPVVVDILTRSPRSNTLTQPKQVWNIVLEITDNFPHTHPHIIVEMSGRKTRGVIRIGDEVIVTGRLDKKANVFVAKYLQSVRTGAKIYSSRF